MNIDVLVAEIGSTTTVVNAFGGLHGERPAFLGQGQGVTTALQGDVRVGLREAMADLQQKLGLETLEYEEFLATSSAAGGLRMTVHGLVLDMTVKASREAALGAGAVIKLVTAGRLKASDLKKIERIRPNMIMIAGGLDYGERETALENAEKIRSLELTLPVIYAGNVENQEEIREIFAGSPMELYVTDNVYPRVDVLQVEPARKIIQAVFEKHIVHAQGMEHVYDLVSGSVMPTPGAVMESAKILKEVLGDVLILDVGGATTDVHSVTAGSEEINRILLAPEPEAKRTVEGDLGIYVNRMNLAERIGEEALRKEMGMGFGEVEELPPVPQKPEEIALALRLTEEAVKTSLERHAGNLRNLYGESAGRKRVAEGKDLTEVKFIIGTGGALTRLPGAAYILEKIQTMGRGERLYPQKEAKVLLDRNYLLASLGVLSRHYPEAAKRLMLESIGLWNEEGVDHVSLD